jgi:aspartate racemase
MSWESSAEYYRLVNEHVKARLGGLHSAHCVLYSVDFVEIERLQQQGQWDAAADLLAQAAQQLERTGADVLVLCTNTMHRVALAIQDRIAIPLLHIADPTAQAITRANMRTVGLLGTRFTMEQDFYKCSGLRDHPPRDLRGTVPGPDPAGIAGRISGGDGAPDRRRC